jgi:hypothetical protein
VTVFLHEWRVIQDHERWPSIRQERKEFEDIVSRQLQRGVDEGLFAVKDVRIATLGFLGMFNYSYQWLRPEGRLDPDELSEQFCDAFVDGIKVKKRAG